MRFSSFIGVVLFVSLSVAIAVYSSDGFRCDTGFASSHSSRVMNGYEETAEYIAPQFDPFQQNGHQAVISEVLTVLVPDFKTIRIRNALFVMIQNILHGRRFFPATVGVPFWMRNTCFRFLNETWLQLSVFRC